MPPTTSFIEVSNKSIVPIRFYINRRVILEQHRKQRKPSFETNIPTGPNSVKGKNENSQQIVCNNNIMDSLTLSQRDLNKFWDDQEVVGQLKEILYTRDIGNSKKSTAKADKLIIAESLNTKSGWKTKIIINRNWLLNFRTWEEIDKYRKPSSLDLGDAWHNIWASHPRYQNGIYVVSRRLKWNNEKGKSSIEPAVLEESDSEPGLNSDDDIAIVDSISELNESPQNQLLLSNEDNNNKKSFKYAYEKQYVLGRGFDIVVSEKGSGS